MTFIYPMASSGFSLSWERHGTRYEAFGLRLLFGYTNYDETAQPSMVIVSTTSSKLTLIRLNTFPCPKR